MGLFLSLSLLITFEDQLCCLNNQLFKIWLCCWLLCGHGGLNLLNTPKLVLLALSTKKILHICAGFGLGDKILAHSLANVEMTNCSQNENFHMKYIIFSCFLHITFLVLISVVALLVLHQCYILSQLLLLSDKKPSTHNNNGTWEREFEIWNSMLQVVKHRLFMCN